MTMPMALVVLTAVLACATASTGQGSLPSPASAAAGANASSAGAPIAYRRLTEGQYRNAIRDVFGAGIEVNARFEPERREEGLQAVGAARLSITTSGLEQYYAVARSVAEQVTDPKARDRLIGCGQTEPGSASSACGRRFIERVGGHLFRRPLTSQEAAGFAATWEQGARETGDLHKALRLALTAMLVSPEFLFRVERAEPDPAKPGAMRLDAYSKAARLSYLLWNAGPDETLLAAAGSGEMHDPAGLRKQVERLIASPRFEDGVRAFFTDMLEFETFDTLSKDQATYPKYSQAVADSAREETLRFLVDRLVRKDGDYRDVFTSRDTFIDRTLAYVYSVPYLSNEKWAAFTFPEDSERSGLLTQVTFLSLFAHPGSSSPTVRGVKLNEIFFCVQVPQPPPDVDFSKVQALEKGTVRTRLLDHMTNPGCAGCHRISDPPGLSLERFDGLGQHRTTENGAPIEVSADVGGRKFNGAQGLGQYVRDDPRTAACLVRKAHYYGVGRLSDPADTDYLARQTRAFTASGYRLSALFRGILTDPQFFRVVAPAGARTGVQTASLSPGANPLSGETR